MKRKQVIAVAVACTLLLAGCTGTGGSDSTTTAETTVVPTDTTELETTDGSGTTTTTTADAETTSADAETTAATDFEGIALPAGASATEFENVSALVRTTKQRLVATNYAISTLLLQDTASGELTVRQHVRSSLDANRRLLVFNASTEANYVYAADGTTYIKAVADGETAYQTSEDSYASFENVHGSVTLSGPEALGGILNAGNYTATGVVERDGQQLVRFELQSVDSDRITGTVTNATGTVLVTSDGVVRDAHLRMDGTQDGEPWVIEQGFEITALGDVTVEEPDWVDEARNSSE